MEERKLKQLLSEMSLREKIGQMIQLTGIYFDEDAVLTGAVGEGQPPQWVIRYAGSVLGMIGAEKAQGDPEKIYERTSASHSAAVYGGCYTRVQDHSSDPSWSGMFLSSGTG